MIDGGGMITQLLRSREKTNSRHSHEFLDAVRRKEPRIVVKARVRELVRGDQLVSMGFGDEGGRQNTDENTDREPWHSHAS